MRTLQVACMLLGVLPNVLSAAEPPRIAGAIAYTDILRYDYTGDGKRNRVQFWLEFDGRPASGDPGAPGYQPEAGTVRYFLRDADDGTKVGKWRKGLDMAGAPKDTPLPMSNIRIDGNTASFEAFGMKWTLIDGGEGYAKDRIIVDDGYRSFEIKKMYGGNIRVGAEKAN